MTTPKLTALFLAVFAIASHAATYVITGSGTQFTATKDNSTAVSTNQPIQTVIDAIRTDANAGDVTIQFGDNSATLDIGTAGIIFGGSSHHHNPYRENHIGV
ncbi:hypothetical protein R83H12_02353 [Fibrobacteria bacterium R8-3-H12]